MKKQLLSVILSFSMVLNNCLDGFIVIAESNVNKDDTENIAVNINDAIDNQEGENTNDDENDSPEDDEAENQTVIELKVVPKENFPFSIYYGQDMPDFNYVEEGKTAPDYYSVVSNVEGESEIIIPETVYENISIVIDDVSDKLSVGDYDLNVVCKEETITNGEITYKIITESLDESFKVMQYNLSEISIKPYVINGIHFIKSYDNNFEISLDETFNEVFESGISVSALKKNENKYYVRNINKKNSETYHAIAGAFIYNADLNFEIYDYAEITNKNLDISTGVYNDDITFNVSGKISAYSKPDVKSIVKNELIVENNGQKLDKTNFDDISVKFIENENKYQFTVPYTLELPENSKINVNLSAQLNIDDAEIFKDLKLNYSGNELENGLILENKPPEVSSFYFNPNEKTIKIAIKDNDSDISSIRYGIEGMKWNNGIWEKSEKTQYIDYKLEDLAEDTMMINLDKNIVSGSYIICLEVKDNAGNILPFKSSFSVDNNPPNIESIELLYQTEDGEWNPVNYDVFFAREYGNYTSQNLRIKVVASKDDIDEELPEVYMQFDRDPIGIQLTKENDYYYIDLTSNEIYENIKIKAVDKYNNYVEKGINEWNISDVKKIASNNLVIDNTAPTGKIQNPPFAEAYEWYENNFLTLVWSIIAGGYFEWYGIAQKGENIVIQAEDDKSGIYSVSVFDNDVLLDEYFWSKDNSYSEYNNSIQIPISEFEIEGKHNLTVSITDNAGNINKEKISLPFKTDFTSPKVSIKDKKWNWISFYVIDNGSGIKNVEYTFDGINWNKPEEPPLKTGDFEYSFTVDGNGIGEYILVRVTDYAGNRLVYPKSEEDSEHFRIPSDDISPQIDEIKIYYDASENGEPDWQEVNKEVFHTYQYGNFTNKPIQIRIKASDPINKDGIASGVASVSVNQSIAESIPKLDENFEIVKDENGNIQYDYYAFNLGVGTDNDISIRVEDESGNSIVVPLYNSEDNKLNIDNFEIFSNHITIDDKAPTGGFNNPEFKVSYESDNNFTNWYGIKEKEDKITITANDLRSGIQSVSVLDNNNELYCWTKDNSKDSQNYNGDISIQISEFEEGKHNLVLILTDNAGNRNEEDISLLFNTDFTRPKGEIELISDSVKITRGEKEQDWFDWSDNIEFNFIIDDDHPDSVVWNVEASQKSADGELKFNNGEKPVSLTTLESGAELDKYGEHSYKVTAKFYDEAGNSSEEGEVTPVIVYKDSNAPEIEQVSISKAEVALDNIIRVLTFGIYSNDKIKLEVVASELAGDSGLGENSVKISTDNLPYDDKEYVTMTLVKDFEEEVYDEKNPEVKNKMHKYQYELIIPAEDDELYEKLISQAISGEIAVRTTDLYQLNGGVKGVHSTSEFDKIVAKGEEIRGNADTKSKNYMIEKVKPTIKITMPSGDGQKRNDNKIWYNKDHELIFAIQDIDSGICNIDVFINDDTLMPMQQNDTIPKFLKEEVSSSANDRETKELIYTLSTDTLISYLATSDKTPEDGHYVIKVVAEDNAGNKQEETIDFYIDKIAPVVDSIDFSLASADNYVDATQFIDILEYGFYFRTELIATVNVSDEIPSSGLHRIEYKLVEYNNGEKGEEHSDSVLIDEEGQASFTIPANFKGQIYVKGFDYVENVSDEVTPQSFVIDTPERHVSENHIEITGLNGSSYSDNKGNALYDTGVTVEVRISDTMSGIRNISYALSSELETQDMSVISISNTDNSVGQDIGDGWIITAMDENLVTEVTRSYSFSSDNNNIQLSFGMTDRANNTSENSSDVFSIDQTAPVIDVVFDSIEANNDYYRENRTAVITITERNFDSSKITASITNEIGNVPGLSFTNNSDTEHVATLVFGEGDYTFSIEGIDLCGHTASVNYSGGNENGFHVDKTNPTIGDNFKEFENNSENSFNVDKVMNFTITEHNFSPELVDIIIYRVDAGQELTSSNRKDYTEHIRFDDWSNNGDIHTRNIYFTDDAVYQVSIQITDTSGRKTNILISPVFEIDKTSPVLETPDNLSVCIYNDNDTEAEPIIFTDSNIKKIHYSVVSYKMKKNEDGVGYGMEISEPVENDVEGDIVIIGDEYFSVDGIYEVKCVAYDVVGNVSEETIHTFVIQRDTDFLVYIPESNKEKQTGLYKFNQKGIRSAAFEDIEIIAYIAQNEKFGIEVDGKTVGDDYISEKEITGDELGSTKKGNEKINQINSLEVTLKNSYFTEVYGSDDVDADLTLNATVSTDNVKQVITLGHIYIDNVKPTGEYEAALRNMGDFDGFYGVENQTIMIEGVSSDIDLSRCEIQVNNDTLTYVNSGYTYDENAHTISFILPKGNNIIRPTLVDLAGNINNLSIKEAYVGEIIERFWYLFFIGGVVIISVPIILIRRRKSK